MGIERHGDWGREAELERQPVRCASDGDLAATPGGTIVSLSGGNIWEALGRPGAVQAGAAVRLVGLDGISVSMTTRSGSAISTVAADSVVVRRPLLRGGPFRGPVVIISSSGRTRGRDVLPRAHPNDGLLDVIVVSSLSARQRIIAWSRARHGSHLPHPGLSVSRERTLHVGSGNREMVVSVDGRRFTCVECTVAVDPDRWQLALPVPTVGG